MLVPKYSNTLNVVQKSGTPSTISASNHITNVSGNLRIFSAACNSDSLLALPIVRFQESYPEVRVQVFTTEWIIPQTAEGIDFASKFGELEASSLVVRRLLTYRH